MGGLKAPDMAALNSALKVKQFINATKSKNKINILQKVFTVRAAPITMTQMVYDSKLCDNESPQCLFFLNMYHFSKVCTNLFFSS